MLAMRASSGLVAGSFSGTCARSHSGHGYRNSSSARLQAPQPACALRRLFGRSDSDPSSPRAAAATSVPAHNSSSSSPLRGLMAAVRGGSSSTRLGRSVVQAAAGRGSSGGRAGGGSASGGGRGSGRDPADDMSACQNLEDLQTFITRRLPVWEGKEVVITMCAAFNKCGKVRGRSPPICDRYLHACSDLDANIIWILMRP